MNATTHTPRTALVVGLGISGISTAIALSRAGWTPVIVEKAPFRRRGGYFIAMFGSGRIAADRLGIEGIRNRVPVRGTTHRVDRAGRRKAGMGLQDLPSCPWMMPRGDVEKAAYEALQDGVEFRYSTTPTRIDQDAEGVTVTLRDTAYDTTRTERFGLVVGADGLCSTVRKPAFGPHEKYLRRLNHMIAAFELPRTHPRTGAAGGRHPVGTGALFLGLPLRGPRTDRAVLLPHRRRRRRVHQTRGGTLPRGVRARAAR